MDRIQTIDKFNSRGINLADECALCMGGGENAERILRSFLLSKGYGNISYSLLRNFGWFLLQMRMQWVRI